MLTVYLAGPIGGQTYGEATDWRKTFMVMSKTRPHLLSPMRGKEHFKGQVLGETGTRDDTKPLSTARAIFTRDRLDIRRSDVVVANFNTAHEKSTGTTWELGYAYALGKIIIVVMKSGNVHDHAFIKESASFIVPTLKDAEDVLDNLE